MKMMIITLQLFSRWFIRELLIMIFVIFLVLAMGKSIAPLVREQAVSRYAKDGLPYETLVFYASERLHNMVDNNGEKQSDTMNQMMHKLQSIEQLIGLGTYRINMYAITSNEEFCKVMAYNDDMISFSHPQLQSGKWLDEIELTDELPLIIGGALGSRYEIGDKIGVDILSLDNDYNRQMSGVVIGKLAEGASYYSISSGASYPGILNIAQYSGSMENDGNDILLCPLSSLGEYQLNELSPSMFLFFETGTDIYEIEQDLNKAMNRYGKFISMENLDRNEMSYNMMHIYNHDIINGITLFCILVIGCGSYVLLTFVRHKRLTGIYAICGMSKKVLLRLYVIMILVLFVPPVIISHILLPMIVVDNSLLGGWVYLVAYGSVILTSGICILIAYKQCIDGLPLTFIRE